MKIYHEVPDTPYYAVVKNNEPGQKYIAPASSYYDCLELVKIYVREQYPRALSPYNAYNNTVQVLTREPGPRPGGPDRAHLHAVISIVCPDPNTNGLSLAAAPPVYYQSHDIEVMVKSSLEKYIDELRSTGLSNEAIRQMISRNLAILLEAS